MPAKLVSNLNVFALIGRRGQIPAAMEFVGNSLVDEIDNGAVAAVQEADELAEVWRCHVVVDGVEVAVIGDVE